MGSENKHINEDSRKQQRKAKRAARNARQQQRNAPVLKSHDRVLIVCEGEKTEPFYIIALRDDLKLNSANIKIIGKECGSNPYAVVDYAIEYYKNNNKFDKIFCIIDRDAHSDYDKAIGHAKKQLEKNDEKQVPKLRVITSIPCFEYWLLLHFVDTDQPFHAIKGKGEKSICDQVGKELKKYLSFYDKGKKLIANICDNQQQIATDFNLIFKDINSECCSKKKEQDCFNYIFNKILKPRQADAKIRAQRIWQQHINTGTVDKNPSTEMHKLVDCLEKIKNLEECDEF